MSQRFHFKTMYVVCMYIHSNCLIVIICSCAQLIVNTTPVRSSISDWLSSLRALPQIPQKRGIYFANGCWITCTFSSFLFFFFFLSLYYRSTKMRQMYRKLLVRLNDFINCISVEEIKRPVCSTLLSNCRFVNKPKNLVELLHNHRTMMIAVIKFVGISCS